MGYGVSRGRDIRDTSTVGSLKCPRCGRANPRLASRCASCDALLGTGAPAEGVDALVGELEALARSNETLVTFECPACGRPVDEGDRSCRCGAVFEEAADMLGYACPLCGAVVSSYATRCRCGAVFAG